MSSEIEATQLGISDWRNKIDVLDEQLVQLINERAQAAIAIGDLKHH
ncbi:MAG TPA: chorismate mutase, partial [Granulicella sp.]|nr:chorismate mutase [Granulicella sp.]